MLGYGRVSETERQSLGDEGLSNLSWVKIQSIPLWKLRGSKGQEWRIQIDWNGCRLHSLHLFFNNLTKKYKNIIFIMYFIHYKFCNFNVYSKKNSIPMHYFL
jgi:hypothetical protein